MVTLRCTQKLLKKVKAQNFDENQTPTTKLGDWYANIIYTRQGHFILAASEKSLLPVIISAKDLKNLVTNFIEQLRIVLLSIGISKEDCEKEIQQMMTLNFGRTKSKVVLGSMNDFALNLKYLLITEKHSSLLDLSINLAKMPCGPLKYLSPIQITNSLFVA